MIRVRPRLTGALYFKRLKVLLEFERFAEFWLNAEYFAEMNQDQFNRHFVVVGSQEVNLFAEDNSAPICEEDELYGDN